MDDNEYSPGLGAFLIDPNTGEALEEGAEIEEQDRGPEQEEEDQFVNINQPNINLNKYSTIAGAEKPAEQILEEQNDELVDDTALNQLKAITGRQRVDANGRPIRSPTNAKMTTFERTKILITRAKQLQLNASPLVDLSYNLNNPLTANMSKQQYELWLRHLLLDPLALAQLELDSGKLNNWIVLKVYPDNSYEVWKVGELPYLRG